MKAVVMLITQDDVLEWPDARETPRHPERRRSTYESFGKRTFDFISVVVIIVFALPILIVVALAVLLTLGGPVLFSQRRVGLDGEDFVMYKFRTMKHSRRKAQLPFDGPDRRQTHKHADDPRHTTLGKILRKTSLDELPQLFNVLKGEMSLVGPRPELSEVADRFGLRHHPRHQVRPGITGTWQTTSRNEGALLHESVDEDLGYLHKLSLRRDLLILLNTGRVLLRPGGC